MPIRQDVTVGIRLIHEGVMFFAFRTVVLVLALGHVGHEVEIQAVLQVGRKW